MSGQSPEARAALRRRRHRRMMARRRALVARWRRHHPWFELTDLQMMERALELARIAARRGEVPVGAVLYRNGVILGEAFNEREAGADPTAHAEVVALRRAGIAAGQWRLGETRMAVTLEPCPMCAGALVNARVSHLVFAAFDPKAGACGTLYEIPSDPRLNHRLRVCGGVMQTRAARQLRAFFAPRRAARRTPRS
ncbi:MAG: tRNA adenosine(34) deaminase TadA [Phycisphaeraceae bacterium]|nr:tRNA adenosine(34) deaminase TadA [Phycisphaeraceae bacterium]